MKRILSILISIILLLSCFSVSTFADSSAMSDEFRMLLNEDGALEFDWAPPKTVESANLLSEVFLTQTYHKYSDLNLFCSLDSQSLIDSNATECKLTINTTGDSDADETHTVPLKFNYKESKIKQFEQFGSRLSSVKNITFEDLELLNYWVANPSEWLLSVNLNIARYSKEIKEVINNKNFDINIVCLGGNEEFCAGDYVCILMLGENGVTYYAQRITATLIHRLYIPSGDYNSREELISAAQERVDDYFGEGIAEVVGNHRWSDQEALDLINDYKNQGNYLGIDWSYLNNAAGNYLFSLKIGGKHHNDYHEFVLIEADSKCKKPHHKTVDLETNISVETDNYVPLDSTISVDKLTSGAEYDNITNHIDAQNKEVYDLSLYSIRKNDYVTKLNTGMFDVKIPISENLKGKDLVVYYVHDDGKLEEHKVTIENDTAVFNTNHFSVYTLAEASKTVANEGQTVSGATSNAATSEESELSTTSDVSSHIEGDAVSSAVSSNQNNESSGNNSIILWVVIIVVLLAAAIGVLVFVFIKKRNNA